MKIEIGSNPQQYFLSDSPQCTTRSGCFLDPESDFFETFRRPYCGNMSYLCHRFLGREPSISIATSDFPYPACYLFLFGEISLARDHLLWLHPFLLLRGGSSSPQAPF